MNTGTIKQIIGPVVDVKFPADILPEIFFALEVAMGKDKLVLEVQQHIGNNMVRCVAMGSTDGLSRGMAVVNTGAQISVPVGDSSPD